MKMMETKRRNEDVNKKRREEKEKNLIVFVC